MTSEVIPDRATAFGERARRRLTQEMAIWLTTVGRDGAPQPNPVGFLWDGREVPQPRSGRTDWPIPSWLRSAASWA